MKKQKLSYEAQENIAVVLCIVGMMALFAAFGYGVYTLFLPLS